MLGGLGLSLEQPLGVREPALRYREGAATAVIPGQGQCETCGPERVAGGSESGERPLP